MAKSRIAGRSRIAGYDPLKHEVGRIRGGDRLEINFFSNDHARDRHIALSGAERLRLANHERTIPNVAEYNICQS